MKYIKCINDIDIAGYYHIGIKLDKIYIAVSETKFYYIIKRGEDLKYYPKELFIDITDNEKVRRILNEI